MVHSLRVQSIMAGKSCEQVLQAAWSSCIQSQESKNDECLYWLAWFYIVQDLISLLGWLFLPRPNPESFTDLRAGYNEPKQFLADVLRCSPPTLFQSLPNWQSTLTTAGTLAVCVCGGGVFRDNSTLETKMRTVVPPSPSGTTVVEAQEA